jgi:hypothetical protein
MSPDLTSLRSVAGVDGAFLFNSAGVLLARDLPDLYTDQFLLSLQNSIQLAFNTADQYIGIYDDLLFCYRERIIYIRRLENLMLCAIALPTSSVDGLRIGTNLLISQARLAASSTTRMVIPGPPPVSGGFFDTPTRRPIPRPSSPTPPPPPPKPKPPAKKNDIWG